MAIEAALIIGAVASVGSAANSVIQGERAQRSARRAGRAQAAALRAEAAAERERSRRLASAQRAAFGAAGVGPQGTPLLVAVQDQVESIRRRERILAGARNAESNARAQGRALFNEGIQGGIQGLSSATTFLADPRFPGNG